MLKKKKGKKSGHWLIPVIGSIEMNKHTPKISLTLSMTLDIHPFTLEIMDIDTDILYASTLFWNFG